MSEKLKYYTVEIEALVPAKIKYQVLAESPEQASEKIQGLAPSGPPQLQLSGLRRIAVRVYDYGTVMMRFMKRF
jgi:hypothetical protein